MTQEALNIREYIINSNLPDFVKNEIVPLLGILETPGVKDRVLKILEIEGKSLDLQEKFVNLDLDNPNASVQQPASPAAPAPSSPLMQSTQATAVVVPPAPVQPATPVINDAPTMPQANSNVDELKKLEDQLKQLQPQQKKMDFMLLIVICLTDVL